METGKIALSGDAKELMNNESIKKGIFGRVGVTMEHTVITIARSYGSGGRTLGKLLAKELGIHCYDRELLRMALNRVVSMKLCLEK